MRILVVAAHPDDEVLGCGGALAGHVAVGDLVKVVFLTDGVGSRGTNENNRYWRRNSALTALAVLGIADVIFFDFPDNSMDQVPRLIMVQRLEKELSDWSPEVIYTHHGGDLNIDHRYALELTLTAFRPVPGSSVQRILSFEVMSSTGWLGCSSVRGFTPNLWIDVTGQIAQKIEALKAYDDEMRDVPHARSFAALQALWTYRGHQVGVVAAEAFVVERMVGKITPSKGYV